MRQRRAEALQRCAKRAVGAGFPMACTVNPFAPPAPLPIMTGVTVLSVAAEVTGITVSLMLSHRRGKHISYARQFAYWLVRKRLGRSKPMIGRLLNKSQWAVRDGIRATDQRLANDWPMIIAWRDRAAEAISRIDTKGRRQREHTASAHRLFAPSTG